MASIEEMLDRPWTCLLCGATMTVLVHECGADLRVSYAGGTRGWVGVLRNAKRRVVVECGHQHRNRDQGSMTNGPAAQGCAQMLLRALQFGREWQRLCRSSAAASAYRPGDGQRNEHSNDVHDLAESIRADVLTKVSA